jgi:RNA:NAD 2'-phosphotransferase (TPT1/KptA family)
MCSATHSYRGTQDSQAVVAMNNRLVTVSKFLSIESARMAADGYKFRQSANEVWLTDHVPPQYIRLLREEDV